MKTRMRSNLTCGIAASLVFAAGAVTVLTPAADASKLKWRTNVGAEARPMTPAQLGQAISAELNGQPARRMVVHFNKPLTDADKADLSASGITTLAYLGADAYFATVRPEAAANLAGGARNAGLATMRSVQSIMTAWKLHPDLNADIVHPWTIVEGGPDAKGADPDRVRDPIVAAYVLFHRDTDMQHDARAILGAVGAQIVTAVDATGIYIVHLPQSQIKTLAAYDAVQWVEPPLPAMEELNATTGNVTGAYAAQAAPYNLSGAGVKVLVYDGGKIRVSHNDYQGRAITGVSDTSSVSDHATHVGCTVAGGGVVAPKGMAPGASIISYGFQQPGGLVQGFLYSDFGDLISDYTEAVAQYGAEITTNSIGTNTAPNGYPCEWEGNYGVTSQVIDQLVRGTPGISNGQPLRVVWANGNERQTSVCNDTTNPGVPAGYHKTAPPSCAKNHITVGAVDGANNEAMSTFSSWGPSEDGRMKPDISAPGVNLLSCGSGSDTSTGTKSGTSMATPATTGNLALLLEDFKARNPSDPLPRNSTLKVFLAHTAVDRGNPGPDNQFGYGTIRILPAIDLSRSDNWTENSASQGSSTSFLVVVPPGNTQPLKVTVAWDDFPNTQNANGQGIGSLINDLDLVVTSPSNVRAFPWTLQGLSGNPSLPAVQTQENHVDNIEQVYVANPEVGVWLVEVRGTVVPEGPQAFSIAASPQFVNCSNTGVAGLDKSVYPCTATANLKVVDCQLNTSNAVIDTVTVNVASTSDPVGVNVLLTEIGAETADFRGSIGLGTTLAVANGDTVTLTYQDADTGSGSPGTVTSTATIDCVGPVISSVSTPTILPRTATVTFNTSEPASGLVRYGSACGTFTGQIATARGTSHTATIPSLLPGTTYFFDISATDDAGNAASNDNGGACFSFGTPFVPDFFTELFVSTNDLDNRTILFTPAPGLSGYTACSAAPIAALPVDPAGGTPLSLTDDSATSVALTGGQTVKLYGVSYPSVFVSSNGFMTFTASDSSLTESYATHFNKPRVSALFDDLNPTQGGGSISYKQLSDRFVVTWLNVPEHNGGNQNTFQISMYFDGRIELSYLAIAAADGLAGLSGSTSVNPDFGASDLTAYGTCGPRPPFAANASYTLSYNTGKTIDLVGGDDGLPGGPLGFYITALPANAVLEDPSTNTNIASVPYLLSGNQVRYKQLPGTLGADSFVYKVNDNGVAPDGGDSGPGTISINVIASGAGLPFSDQFPSTTFDTGNWATVGGATIDAVGIAEPSAPNSARFNGTPASGDNIVSRVIDLSLYTNLRVAYAFQVRGGGESPDSGDNLFIDYLNNTNTWTNLQTHLGTLPDGSTYTLVDVPLPADGKHGAFQLRVRSTATAGAFDDWFVDDVSITGAICQGDANGDGVINTADLTLLLGNFGDIAAGFSGGDFNVDGTVDTADLTALLQLFGTSCN